MPPRGGCGDPVARPLPGIVAHDDVGDNRRRRRTGGKHIRCTFKGNAADGDQRTGDPRSPFADAGEALRLPRHHFELGRIDGPKRDIIGAGRKRVVELIQAVGADAELDAGSFERLRDLRLHCGGRRILDAQLDKSCALAREPRDPGGVGKDRIERIEQARAQETRSILKNGVPATGVEGEAMSRGSISPASKPRRPASTARAKASAIFTGSPALATAVLSSTAS